MSILPYIDCYVHSGVIMIIWTCMRTGGTVLINHLMKQDNTWRDSLPDYFSNAQISKKEYGKLWSYDKLNPNQEKSEWTNWANEIDYYKLYTKIYDRNYNNDFYKAIAQSTKNSKHIILYRENSFERAVSNFFRDNCLSLDKKTITIKDINVDLCLSFEISVRNHFMNAIRFLDSYEAISYEDIFIRKDIEKLNKIFPNIDHMRLFESQRYDYHNRYEEMGNYEELREKFSKFPKFIL